MDARALDLALKDLIHKGSAVPLLLDDGTIARLLEQEVARLCGRDAPPVPRASAQKRKWAPSLDSYARSISDLAWKAMHPRGEGMPIQSVVDVISARLELLRAHR